MEFRQVQQQDVGACLDVFYAAVEDLTSRLGQPQLPRNPDALGRVFQHLAGTDPARCWLADDGDRVVAFGMAHQRDDHWYLGFLFVLPDWQNRGVGRSVLERCLPPEHERADTRLSVAVQAAQPVSTALYAQYGLVPRTPLYVLTGDLRPGMLPDPGTGLADSGLDAVAFRALNDPQAVAVAVDALDRQVVGYARPQEHRFLAVPDRQGFLYRQGSEMVAYGYAQPSGRIGPICATDPDVLGGILGHLVSVVRPVGGWQVIVPGPAAGALVLLLRAGLRIDGGPALFCSTWNGPQFDRYLPMNFALN